MQIRPREGMTDLDTNSLLHLFLDDLLYHGIRPSLEMLGKVFLQNVSQQLLRILHPCLLACNLGLQLSSQYGDLQVKFRVVDNIYVHERTQKQT